MTIHFKLFFTYFFTSADNHRPYLITFQSNDSTDYINAVFVDVIYAIKSNYFLLAYLISIFTSLKKGYTRSREYIVTEWPLHFTIPDCWSLIYDHDCNSVIILANPEDLHVSQAKFVIQFNLINNSLLFHFKDISSVLAYRERKTAKIWTCFYR